MTQYDYTTDATALEYRQYYPLLGITKTQLNQVIEQWCVEHIGVPIERDEFPEALVKHLRARLKNLHEIMQLFDDSYKLSDDEVENCALLIVNTKDLIPALRSVFPIASDADCDNLPQVQQLRLIVQGDQLYVAATNRLVHIVHRVRVDHKSYQRDINVGFGHDDMHVFNTYVTKSIGRGKKIVLLITPRRVIVKSFTNHRNHKDFQCTSSKWVPGLIDRVQQIWQLADPSYPATPVSFNPNVIKHIKDVKLLTVSPDSTHVLFTTADGMCFGIIPGDRNNVRTTLALPEKNCPQFFDHLDTTTIQGDDTDADA